VDLKFDHIQYLHLLWGVLLVAGVYAYGFFRKTRALGLFATANLFSELMPRYSPGRQKLKAALVLLAMVLLILGATGPRWGKESVDLQRKGIDLIVCLDVSRSMLAEDIAPSRLERAKLELGDMLGQMHGDRVGLVTFAGTATRSCPLTINYGAYRMTLNEVNTRSTARGGSLIGDAVRVAAESFTDKVKGHKAVLVITDGEDHQSFPVEAAADAFRERGIRVFTVGIGDTGQGTRIPVTVDGQ
jgi:Ca-activated chloride channel family protein